MSEGQALSPKEKIQDYFKILDRVDRQGLNIQLYPHLTLHSAVSEPSPSRPHHSTVVFGFKVPDSLCNGMGTLHGGAVAAILDLCTGIAIVPVSAPGFWDGLHVSRNLNITYLRSCKEGDELEIECQVVSLGRSLGVMSGVVKGPDGRIAYTCEHQKFHLGGSKDKVRL